MEFRRRLLAAAGLSVAILGSLAAVACGLDAEGTCTGSSCFDATTGDSRIDGTQDARTDAGDGKASDHVTDHGCTGPADCPAGEACNAVTGKCSKSCASGLICNGGCCDEAGTCVGGGAPGACGSKGQACATCTGAASSCIGGVCSADCDGGGCMTNFCCSSDAGACVMSAPTSCGSKAPCVSCMGNPGGSVCLPSEVCGCNAPMDCPLPGYSCSAGHQCVTTCTGTGMGACNSGCCSSSGMCALGNEPSACGTMGTCTECVSNGNACLDGGTCGCVTQDNCDAGNACNPMGKCSPSCGAGASPCNGSCCDPMGQMCQPGDASTACGPPGGACQACPMNGSACFGDGGCGCKSTNDCESGYACNNGACTTACNGTNPCKGGCCDTTLGTCQTGNADQACALFGLTTCTDCTTSCNHGPKCLMGGLGNYCGCGDGGDCTNDTNCDSNHKKCDNFAGATYCGN